MVFALATHCRDMYSAAIQNNSSIPFYIFSLQLPIICLVLLFPFLLGAMARKYKLFDGPSDKWKGYRYVSLWLFPSLLLALILFRCLWNGQYFNFAYAFVFIVLFLKIPLPRGLKSILYRLGKRSMDMWMIHTWICYYLFRDFIYGLQYPLVMLVVLIILSYLASVVVNNVVEKVQKMITT